MAIGAGSAVVLDVALVRGTESSESSGLYGEGVFANEGGAITASRIAVVSNRHAGVAAFADGSTISLIDAVVLDTRVQTADSAFGRGVDMSGGAHLDATRLLVARNQEVGVIAVGYRTSAMLSDIVIRDTRPQQDEMTLGRGVDLQGASSLVAERMIAIDNFESPVSVDGADTMMTLTDAALIGGDGERAAIARGIGVQVGASIVGTRVLVERAREIGVAVDMGAHAVLTDVVVRNTDARGADLAFGHGITVQNGADLTAERVVVDGAHEAGLLSLAGATVDARDTVVRTVTRSLCPCAERVFGFGAAAIGDASLTLERFEIADVETCGLIVASTASGVAGASLDLATGRVERSAIGACVQVNGYDLGRLMHEVVYADNGTNLETTNLPVPEPAQTIER